MTTIKENKGSEDEYCPEDPSCVSTEIEEREEEVDSPLDLTNEIGYVLPYLYFGSMEVAADPSILEHHGITHIFSVIGEPEVEFEDILYEYSIGIRDRSDQFILPELVRCNDFINQARRRGGIVLVHCRAGISRSAAFAIGHLILTYGFTFHDALDLVRSDRPEADPNDGFCDQLKFLADIFACVRRDVSSFGPRPKRRRHH